MSLTDSDTPSAVASYPGRLAVLFSRVPLAVVITVCSATILALVVAGILQRVWYPEWSAANLDSEISIATWFSSALLWMAAFWWLLVGVAARPRSVFVWMWSGVLVWLALDEGNAFHEQVERWSGIDWQLLYVPIMGVAAVAWAGVLRRFRYQSRIVALLIAAAGSWGIALALELIQNWGGEPVRASIYDPTMITEEALEMIGSTVLLIAAMLALRHAISTTPR